MANVDSPFGLRPTRHKNGAPYNGAASIYYVPASDGTALYIGDPVIVAGSGDSRGVPSVTRATAAGGSYITGVVVGVFSADNGKPVKLRDDELYRAASTEAYVLVADDPDIVFEVQEDSVGAALAATNIGQNVDLVAGTGSTATGLSGWEIDSSTAATTGTLQCKILRLVDREDNEIGNQAKWEVMINLHSQRNAAGV